MPNILTESHIVIRLANDRASFLNMNDINDISFLENLATIIVVERATFFNMNDIMTFQYLEHLAAFIVVL
jgi:hypothetical protein